MTTLDQRDVICALCGTVSRFDFISSTSSFGSPDLDLRPPMLERSTLVFQVQVCPHCGLCGFDLEQAPAAAAALVGTAHYRRQLQNTDLPSKANALLCLSLLREASGDDRGAAMASLQAAWLCDDSDNADGSRQARLQAARFLERSLQGGKEDKSERGVDYAILVDVLRRAGQFPAALAACEVCRRLALPPIIEQVLAFQGKLIEEEDTSGYRVDVATGGV